jgi:predicted DNA-binding antitoxin AbrB/MazE fold protein
LSGKASDPVDLYEGRVKIVRMNEERLDDLNDALTPFVNDIKEGEKLHVSLDGDVLTVKSLKKKI